MRIVIFVLSLLVGSNVWAKAGDTVSSFEMVQEDAKALLDKCKSEKWNKGATYSDLEMAEITSTENKCLKKKLEKLIDENFSLPKQQPIKKQVLQNLEHLEKSYKDVYDAVANQSNRCIENEKDIFSCGTAAVLITPSMWQKQLQEMIVFVYSYSYGY